jgi:hypothetical protein
MKSRANFETPLALSGEGIRRVVIPLVLHIDEVKAGIETECFIVDGCTTSATLDAEIVEFGRQKRSVQLQCNLYFDKPGMSAVLWALRSLPPMELYLE